MNKKIIFVVLIVVVCAVVVLFNLPKKANNEFVLQTNGGLPTQWECKVKDEAIVVIDNIENVDKDPGSEGGRIDIHYTLKGLKEGSTQVVCNKVDKRDNSIESQRGFDVKVDGKLNLTITETDNFDLGGDYLKYGLDNPEDWKYEIEDESVVVVDHTDEKGTYNILYFKGLKEDSTVVKFTYLGKEKDKKSYDLTLYVDSDLTVKYTNNQVVLEKNGGTPYEWKYEIEKDIIELANKTNDGQTTTKGGLVQEKYRFKGIKGGLTTIKFIKVNTTENNKVVEEKTYYAYVDMDLDVDIIEKPDAEIILKTNGGVPYNWEYDIKDDSIVEFERVKSFDLYPGSAGGSVEEHYFLKGLKEGTTTITFKYVDFRNDEVHEEKTYTITVDKDLEVTVKENK